MAVKTTTLLEGRIFFPPRNLPSEPGQSPLTYGQILVIDKDSQSIDIAGILGMPSDIAPGQYKIECEVRPKKGRQGMSFWYVSANKVS